jgi:autotransporter-associated beta strand protein
VLSGTNSYTGGTNINAGIVAVSNDANLGAPSGGLSFNGGTLRFLTSFDTGRAIELKSISADIDFETDFTNVLSGPISGNGDLLKGGSGRLILSGENTYSGGTQITAGTLQIGDGGTKGSIQGDVINSGTLAFNRSDTYSFGGNIADGTAPGRVVQNGTGTTILSGIHSYTGPTTINAGSLIVNGSIASSAITVNAGGTLGGNGIIGTTTLNGGTLAPGASIGTLTVQGSLVITAAASYIVEVSPSAADRTNVIGSATLGGTVQAVFTPGGYIARTYTILSANGGLTGTFGSLTTNGLPAGFEASLSYTGTEAILNLTAILGQGPGQSLPWLGLLS